LRKGERRDLAREKLIRATRRMSSGGGLEHFVKLGDEGLSRVELRLLVRRGYLEKVRVVGKRKWDAITPTESFVYRLTGKEI